MDTLHKDIAFHLFSLFDMNPKIFGCFLSISKHWKSLTMKYGRFLCKKIIDEYTLANGCVKFSELKGKMIEDIVSLISEDSSSITIRLNSRSILYTIGNIESTHANYPNDRIKEWNSKVSDFVYAIKDIKAKDKLARSRIIFHEAFEKTPGKIKSFFRDYGEVRRRIISFLKNNPYISSMLIQCDGYNIPIRELGIYEGFNKKMGFKYWLIAFFDTFYPFAQKF